MKGSAVRIAANVATVLFAVVAILQLLLAAGILPVTMAWGGTQPVLTPTLRFASLLAAAILLFFAYVIRRRAGLIGDKNISTAIKILSWIITAFLLLNTVGNLASQSVEEKFLFTPITFVLAVACFVVASSRT
jgi:fucose 4-O-acetylase-like acetyltransferase